MIDLENVRQLHEIEVEVGKAYLNAKKENDLEAIKSYENTMKRFSSLYVSLIELEKQKEKILNKVRG